MSRVPSKVCRFDGPRLVLFLNGLSLSFGPVSFFNNGVESVLHAQSKVEIRDKKPLRFAVVLAVLEQRSLLQRTFGLALRTGTVLGVLRLNWFLNLLLDQSLQESVIEDTGCLLLLGELGSSFLGVFWLGQKVVGVFDCEVLVAEGIQEVGLVLLVSQFAGFYWVGRQFLLEEVLGETARGSRGRDPAGPTCSLVGIQGLEFAGLFPGPHFGGSRSAFGLYFLENRGPTFPANKISLQLISPHQDWDFPQHKLVLQYIVLSFLQGCFLLLWIFWLDQQSSIRKTSQNLKSGGKMRARRGWGAELKRGVGRRAEVNGYPYNRRSNNNNEVPSKIQTDKQGLLDAGMYAERIKFSKMKALLLSEEQTYASYLLQHPIKGSPDLHLPHLQDDQDPEEEDFDEHDGNFDIGDYISSLPEDLRREFKLNNPQLSELFFMTKAQKKRYFDDLNKKFSSRLAKIPQRKSRNKKKLSFKNQFEVRGFNEKQKVVAVRNTKQLTEAYQQDIHFS